MSLTVRLDEQYPATPERVYRAWTEIEQLSRWFGCAPGQLWTIHQWDCHVGGRLEVSMTADGQLHHVEGEFLAVQPAERLTFRFGPTEIIEVRFHRVDGGCRVEVVHRDVPDAANAEIRTGGWTWCLADLARHLTT